MIGDMAAEIASIEADVAALVAGTGAGSESMIGGFEGASRFDRDMATWFPPIQSADGEILPDKLLMDSRVRDTLRNDGYVRAGATIRMDRIVGAMYLLNSKPNWKVLGLDDTWAEEFQVEVESKFTLYAESPECWIHAGRKMTFTDIIRLSVGMDIAVGEFLATAEWLRGAGRPYHTAIQVIDLDRLSNPRGEMDSQTLRGGVRRDRWGAPIGYYFRQAHPADWTSVDNFTWKYVPARRPWGRPMVIHNFETKRPDQSRGISDVVTALKEIRTTRRFRDITLQSAVLNATYAASIESELPTEAVYNMMGGGEGAGNFGSAIAQYAQQYLGAIAEYVGSSRNIRLDGVKIPHLFPGTKLNMQPVGKDNNVGSEFEKSLLRYIASSLNVDVHELTQDWTSGNYSNLKASIAATERTMAAKKRRTADRNANLIFRLWLEEAINRGEITSMPRNAPSLYEGLNMEAYSSAEWIGATNGQIDELKETQAAVLRLKYNITTLEDETARLGKDWRRVLAQAEREKKEREARGLAMPESNMINAASGAPREKERSDEPEDGSQEKTDV